MIRSDLYGRQTDTQSTRLLADVGLDAAVNIQNQAVAKTPAARWGNAEDLGGPAVFLASEASDFVNGLILYVDGGILAYIGKQPG